MPRPATTAIQIIHYNDVYNIDVAPHEPVGGAARFVTAVRNAATSYPGPSIVVFSGDAFSPAPLTVITHGAEIPPILNATAVDVACIGNHEFDRGLAVMKARVAETSFPWIVSNVTEKSTALPLGGINDFHVLDRAGLRIGFLGLAGPDWLATLDKVPADRLVYVDYVEAADRYAALLRDEHKCDYVIAVTHMRQPDDNRLAREAKDVDLILGGHDHMLYKKFINGRYVVKSGTDFKNFSTIELDVDSNWSLCASEPVHLEVTSDIQEDFIIANFVKEKLVLLGDSRWDVLATSELDLDGRFASIRTRETGLGNFIADVCKLLTISSVLPSRVAPQVLLPFLWQHPPSLLEPSLTVLYTSHSHPGPPLLHPFVNCFAVTNYMGAKIGLINAGSFRSDSIQPPGEITQQTIDTILPFHDEAVLVEISGRELLAILENSVSQYPQLDGRFCQVSGITFSFDPHKPPGARIKHSSVMCKGEDGSMGPIEQDVTYRCALKTYIFEGKDGYVKGDSEQILERSDTTIQNMVTRYLCNNPAEINGPGVPTIAAQCENRITCVCPHQELLARYES